MSQLTTLFSSKSDATMTYDIKIRKGKQAKPTMTHKNKKKEQKKNPPHKES